MRSFLLSSLILLSLPFAGCNFYFDDDDPCEDLDYGAAIDIAPELLRNPYTGQCEEFGYQGPYPCDEQCGPCAYPAEDDTPLPPSPGTGGDPGSSDPAPSADRAPAAEALPSWGYCQSNCTGLSEAACLVTDSCRGIYGDAGGSPGEFLECWQTDQSPPIEPVDCTGLDAFNCSQLDYCVASHVQLCSDGDLGADQQQIPEPGGCGVADFMACHNEPEVACNRESCDLMPPVCQAGEEAQLDVCGCPTGACIQNLGCSSDADCGYYEECRAPDVCTDCDGPVCPGCIATCQPVDPGQCYSEAICEIVPPLCEAGTVPGIANDCYTGYCIVIEDCEPASCDAIGNEASCIYRSDCSPYYEGQHCVCDDDGCICDTWEFQSCEAM